MKDRKNKVPQAEMKMPLEAVTAIMDGAVTSFPGSSSLMIPSAHRMFPLASGLPSSSLMERHYGPVMYLSEPRAESIGM